KKLCRYLYAFRLYQKTRPGLVRIFLLIMRSDPCLYRGSRHPPTAPQQETSNREAFHTHGGRTGTREYSHQ
ncbi:MAG TPA: hypothetical protein PLO50_13385, partial [Nitrospira sp.]|nr:hypothetical protein [Nitrospira sp.]